MVNSQEVARQASPQRQDYSSLVTEDEGESSWGQRDSVRLVSIPLGFELQGGRAGWGNWGVPSIMPSASLHFEETQLDDQGHLHFPLLSSRGRSQGNVNAMR